MIRYVWRQEKKAIESPNFCNKINKFKQVEDIFQNQLTHLIKDEAKNLY